MINRKNIEIKNVVLLTAVNGTDNKFYLYNTLDEEYIGHNYGSICMTLRESLYENRKDLTVFIAAKMSVSNIRQENGYMVCNASIAHIIPIPTIEDLIYIKVDGKQLSFYNNVEEKVYEDGKPESYTLSNAIDNGATVYITGKYNIQLYMNIARIYTDNAGLQKKVLYDGGKILHPEIAIPVECIL